ncbi:hypothetical protein OIU79_029306 [Salix purpurea]|uniref:Uncharacterized protein n=1 Tax=Salix purpurea TaxID=77065 RepID=A0A9Q0ZV82_SALPP|nr:hypothetical protein OIU79_029306 [Salix purpurea]
MLFMTKRLLLKQRQPVPTVELQPCIIHHLWQSWFDLMS